MSNTIPIFLLAATRDMEDDPIRALRHPTINVSHNFQDVGCNATMDNTLTLDNKKSDQQLQQDEDYYGHVSII